jgi:hypothetical protein
MRWCVASDIGHLESPETLWTSASQGQCPTDWFKELVKEVSKFILRSIEGHTIWEHSEALANAMGICLSGAIVSPERVSAGFFVESQIETSCFSPISNSSGLS